MPPARRRNDAHAFNLPIQHEPQVELAHERFSFLDVRGDAPLLPGRPGLDRDQGLAEHTLRRLRDRMIAAAQLTPPALPRPPACICAFMAQCPPPSSVATYTACSGLYATPPGGAFTPNADSNSLAWSLPMNVHRAPA